MTDDLVGGRTSGHPLERLPGRHGDGAVPHSLARGVRILHVEDDELNRALVRTALARSTEPMLCTARLIEAADIACARAILAEAPVDVVLLDMRLPDGSGLALAAEMQRADLVEPPIVVALSGAVEMQQRGAALAAGCAAVLSKPYPMASLCDLLIVQLRRRAAEPGGSAEDKAASTSSNQSASTSSN